MKIIITVLILMYGLSSQAFPPYTDSAVKKDGCKYELVNKLDDSVERLILPPDAIEMRQVLINKETYYKTPPEGGLMTSITVDKAAWVVKIGDCREYGLAEFDDISEAWVTGELIREVE